MPEPNKRSRTFRRIQTKVPGGNTILHYAKRKPSHAKCGKCNAVLKGVPREVPSKLNKLPRSKRSPERPYGGNLCSKCTRTLMINKARS